MMLALIGPPIDALDEVLLWIVFVICLLLLFRLALYIVVKIGTSMLRRVSGGRIGGVRAGSGDQTVRTDNEIRAGVVIADYVDEKVLASIAKQKGLETEPNRRERARRSTRSGDVSAGRGRLRGRLGRERSEDEREFFDVERDPNSVLQVVLERLEVDRDVDQDIGHAPLLSIDDRSLEQLRDFQQGEGIDGFREHLVTLEKRKELEQSADSGLMTLIESDWKVEAVEPKIVMRLATFRAPLVAPRAGGEPEELDRKPSSVPEGIVIEAVFAQAGLTEKGKMRLLDGNMIRAGVLATISAYRTQSGTLELSPIAVFGRYGRQSRHLDQDAAQAKI